MPHTSFPAPTKRGINVDDSKVPVYVIAHNPNWVSNLEHVLTLGANAIEPDVNFDGLTNDLCFSHYVIPNMWLGEHEQYVKATGLVEYLHAVRSLLNKPQHAQLALIVFDIKLDEPSYGGKLVGEWLERLQTMVNEILGDSGLRFIYSFPKRSLIDHFFYLKPDEHSGVMIDQEGDVEEVTTAFEALEHVGWMRNGYGDGTHFVGIDKSIGHHMQKALYKRATEGKPRWVETWVLQQTDNVRQYFQLGVDGIIVTDDTIEGALDVLKEPELASRLRLATRNDDPFSTKPLRYAIEISTLDRRHAGTDAVVSVELIGPAGKVKVQIDGSWQTIPPHRRDNVIARNPRDHRFVTRRHRQRPLLAPRHRPGKRTTNRPQCCSELRRLDHQRDDNET